MPFLNNLDINEKKIKLTLKKKSRKKEEPKWEVVSHSIHDPHFVRANDAGLALKT